MSKVRSNTSKSQTLLLLLVEGPTEEVFYKELVKHAHDNIGSLNVSFEIINIKGVGNYKSDALRRFISVQRKYSGWEIYVMLCLDHDVFERGKKPPIDKSAIRKALIEKGAKSVIYIEAVHSIEDWFLDDFDGVISFLSLPRNTRKPSGVGQKILEELYRKKNDIYSKGIKSEGLIKALDVSKIMSMHCRELQPLCKAAGFDCCKVCHSTTNKHQK